MYERSFLGLSEAQQLVEAVIAEARQDPSRPVAVAVVDAEGDLIAFARMDGASYLSRGMARRKAYTSARMGADSGAFGERMAGVVSPLNGLGDPMLVGFAGGVCIRSGDSVVGAVAVSGRSGSEDEDLARHAVASSSL